jgi:glyoxylase-like metal-dependent hydrolase (beta-lactamase superfamily II)
MHHIHQWFDGIYLVGQFNWFRTGCWLLAHGGRAAVLEMPPAGPGELSPAAVVAEAVAQLSIVSVKYLLCTHTHWDHFSRRTYHQLRAAFPTAETHLHHGFRQRLGDGERIHYFEDTVRLDVASEPLYLVHAPKHSLTDTIVIFRGAACTGDWELGTIRSVHDRHWFWAVPREQKLHAIARMERFPTEHGYCVHRVFSVHANDRREGVDFPQLIASTREDRPL